MRLSSTFSLFRYSIFSNFNTPFCAIKSTAIHSYIRDTATLIVGDACLADAWDGHHVIDNPTQLHCSNQLALYKLSSQQLTCLAHRLNQPLLNLLSDQRLNPRPIQSLRSKPQVPIQEESNAMSMLISASDDAMACTAIIPSRVLFHHVAHVDDEAVGDGGNRDPSGGWRVEDLKTSGFGFLQEYGDQAEVSVVGDCGVCFV
ncbi:hypothetical protein IAQ61_000478 [Plenodomus lingam]|uniref:uncharacterized protein n=1 Tax=Leptosphaeria maculans TaxID=5022 RepID=UPI0033224562|nr:hypothetical protein IAQ61_000478 [Plenodomus lingam]